MIKLKDILMESKADDVEFAIRRSFMHNPGSFNTGWKMTKREYLSLIKLLKKQYGSLVDKVVKELEKYQYIEPKGSQVIWNDGVEARPVIKEKSPKGWEGTVKSMKKDSDIDNPWALAHWMKKKGYKSHKKESVNESMDDLVIKRGLELSLKDAGLKVKKFKKAKPGYNKIWAGVFHTKNAVMSFSYSKSGDVFYGGKNVGKLNSKGLLNWLKDIKSNNKWMESIDEKVARPMSYRLRKAQDEIEYMIKQGPLDDEDVYSNSGQAMKLLRTAQKALGKIK